MGIKEEEGEREGAKWGRERGIEMATTKEGNRFGASEDKESGREMRNTKKREIKVSMGQRYT